MSSKRHSRKYAMSPGSEHWTLYRPADLSRELGCDIGAVEIALERTGFKKAVRIREELIRLKSRLKNARRAAFEAAEAHRSLAKKEHVKMVNLDHQLEDIRDVLRLPRKEKR